MLNIKFKKLVSFAQKPEYKTSDSSGMDLYAMNNYKIEPKSCELIDTGIVLEIPNGYEGQIRSRSGIALNSKTFVLNSPGTIDSDYRGSIKVILFNLSEKTFHVNKYDRIAQLVISKVEKVNLIENNNISITERNDGGFGHTGVNNDNETKE